MVSIAISPEEVASGQMSAEHLSAAVDAVRTDGFVILEDVVDTAHLDVLHERLLEDLLLLQARTDGPFNWHAGNVQQDPPPFPPYLFKDVLVNEMVIAVTSAILGPGIINNMYSGNTALPSDQRQPVHADTGHLWPVSVMDVAHPPSQLVVNIATVDVSAENGSTEIWPGTHVELAVGVGEDIKIPADILERRRAEVPPIQASYRRGSAVIRDVRLWHAGMPNTTSEPRPMMATIHNSYWLNTGTPLRFPKGTEEFFEHPVLRTDAKFVDLEEIDHINAPQGHEFNPAMGGTAAGAGAMGGMGASRQMA